MIKFMGITKENNVTIKSSLNNISLPDYKWYWVDFQEPTNEEISHLADTFHFHPLAIEDCIHRMQRPKLDYYDDYTFYVIHLLQEDEQEISKAELDFFIGENYVVSFHHQPLTEIDQVWNRLAGQEEEGNWDSYYVLYEVFDKIVDSYFPLIYQIEDKLDMLDDNKENKSMNLLMNELFDTRHMLLNIRHTINPMRDLLYRMLNSHHLDGIRERREYFSDIYDHLLKLSEMVLSNRELTSDIRDNYLSLNSHQTNNVMKVLTIITSIFAPLTFIAGIYGMNFENMPELTWKYSYFVTIGFMVVISITMYAWFKKKGWFRS
ncbi:magnesium/cobalt transporter CorA [Sutcliffiella deserti]|uniref:magnesium/cobalt transporter CorA n=1 Tax=Sutcliffiella deserti TaxID=2875501 RepID=UPI001CBB19DF|nr:magnesium/cobalt transporter CorA [Sutcliffiella deserti]